MKPTEVMERMVQARQNGNEALVAAYEAMGETQLSLRSTKRQLADSATCATQRLENLVNAIDAYDPESNEAAPHINSLGVLQGLGTEVDRLCGETAVLIKILGTMRNLVKTIEGAGK